MPRKRIRNKKKNRTGEISPMLAFLLKSTTRKYMEDFSPDWEKVLRYYVLRCGYSPDDYIEKLKKKGTVIEFKERKG